MGRIVVIGSINMDIVSIMDRLPKPGETVFGKELQYIPGGKGANQAVAACRLGGKVEMIGRVGSDEFGQALRNFLKGEGIGIKKVNYTKGTPTGTAMVWINGSSQNSIVVMSGSNGKVTERDAIDLGLKEDDIVVSQFEIPNDTIFAAFKEAKSKGARTVLNLAPAVNCPSELLALADYMILNEHEAAFFSGSELAGDLDTVKRYAKKLQTRADQAVIITMGAEGAFCGRGAEEVRVEGVKVNAVDTTAAGDCFTGAFAVALSEHKSLTDSLGFANRAAAISVQRIGASSSLPTRKEMDVAIGKP